MTQLTKNRPLAACILVAALAYNLVQPAAAAQDFGGPPLSTAGLSPHFDWGDGQGAGASKNQTMLRGSVKVNHATPPALINSTPSLNPATTSAQPAVQPSWANYIGTPPKQTLHGAMPAGLPGTAAGAGIDRLFAMRSPADEVESAKKANGPFHVNFKKVVYRGKGILNSMIDYRAFGPSTEAANLILEEHKPSKSTEAQAFAKQRAEDARQLQLASDILQLSMGLGMANSPRGERLVSSSLASLKEQVGEAKAKEILSSLRECSANLKFPASMSSEDVWDMSERTQKIDTIIKKAVAVDPVIDELRKDLHKYNHHSKIFLCSTGLVLSALNIAMFSPTLVAPVAESASFLLVQATGGPEQDKLLRELYLSKRIDSRIKTINEKAHLAVETYHTALLTENPLLLECTKSLVRQLAGPETEVDVFGNPSLAARGPITAPKLGDRTF